MRHSNFCPRIRCVCTRSVISATLMRASDFTHPTSSSGILGLDSNHHTHSLNRYFVSFFLNGRSTTPYRRVSGLTRPKIVFFTDGRNSHGSLFTTTWRLRWGMDVTNLARPWEWRVCSWLENAVPPNPTPACHILDHSSKQHGTGPMLWMPGNLWHSRPWRVNANRGSWPMPC